MRGDKKQQRIDLNLFEFKIDLETFEPSKRNVLYLIGKYPFAFSVAGLGELKEKFYAKSLPKNVRSFHKIAIAMADQGFIETGLAKTTIKAKGRWYQFYSNPARWIWRKPRA